MNEVLVDITPHTLSAGVLGELSADPFGPGPQDVGDLDAAAVIPRDTVVPVERSKIFRTLVEDQSVVTMPIVQGEGPTVGANAWLGEVSIEDLPPGPAGAPVETKFRLDLSGVLEVVATHLPSGAAARVTIANSPSRLSDQRREAARVEVERLREEGDPTAAEAPERDADRALAAAMLARARRALAAFQERSGDEADARQRAAHAEASCARLEAALDAASPDVGTLTDALSDALLDLT